MNMKLALKLLCLLAPTSLFASEDIADQYPDSMLYAKPVEFIPGVFSATGATAPPTYDNAGHNNNLSFIITGEGVVVVNGGGSYLLAKALHDEIKAITDQEVVLIVDENGQGHAMLGNSYWVGQGVKIIAHVDAAAEFEERGFRSLASMQRLNKERGEGTFVQGPTETFTDEYSLELGDFQIEVRYLGPSHSAGDVVVWLPKQSLVIAGDMAFHERLLPIFEDTYTLDWLETWDTEFEALNATYVIPGHGHPTNMAQVRRYTKGYLEHLRGQIGTLIEDGGGLAEAYYVDQSPYVNL
ncbi:MAG: glyoxylase-like metal-dependent hydrolase (beta-lactamase superfamily II), partial [Yoonia sp.]